MEPMGLRSRMPPAYKVRPEPRVRFNFIFFFLLFAISLHEMTRKLADKDAFFFLFFFVAGEMHKNKKNE